ncbi:MAG: YfhO family protein [Kiritimatiellia bacterium]
MLPTLFTGSWFAQDGMGNAGAPYNVTPGYALPFLVPFTKYVDANAIFALFFMGLGGYFLLYDMTRNRFAAFMGGLFLMLQPHVLSHLLPGHSGHFVMAAWVPLIFLFTRRAVLTGGFINWVMAGSCMGAMVAAGQHDVAAFLCMAVAAYGLFLLVRSRANRTTPRQWAGTFGGILVAGILVVLMSYQALFANLVNQVAADKSATSLENTSGQSMSSEEKWFWATQWSVPPVEMIDTAVPGFFGWGSSDPVNPYRGRIGQTEGWMTHRQGMPNLNDVCQYLGAITLLGLLLALVFRWRDPEVWFFAVAGGITLLLAFGKFGPLYRLFFSIPGMDSLRNPIKWFYVTSLSAGVLGALGLAEATRMDAPAITRMKAALLAFIPGLMLLAAGMVLLGQMENNPFPFWQQKALVRQSAESVGWAALFWGAGGLALYLMLTGRGAKKTWSQRLGMAMAIAAMTAELFYVNSHYMPYHAWEPEVNGGPFTPFVKSVQMPCRFRFLRQDGIFHHIREISAMEGMEFADPFPSRLPDAFLILQRRLEQADPIKFWRLCNVRYIVAPAALKDPLLQPVLSLKAGNTSVVIHELKTALSRCVRVTRWRAVPEKEAAELMAARGFDPGQEVLVHAPASDLPVLSSTAPSPSSCRITSFSLTRVIAETESDQPGMVVFLTRYHPDWRATVDGQPVPCWKANGIMQACPVPAGKHTLEWAYTPSGGKRALQVALAGWGLSAFLIFVGVLLVIYHKRNPRP